MGKMKTLRQKLLKHKITIEELTEHEGEFLSTADKIIAGRDVDPEDFEAFLRLCLDVYAYHPGGKVLIPDRMYDLCMSKWIRKNDVVVYPDDILSDSGKWPFKEHTVPGLVGTLGKIYTYEELKLYVEDLKYIYESNVCVLLAPKYDGISVVITVKDGEIISALTRYDGELGQDITPTIRLAKMHPGIPKVELLDGMYKCEVLVATPDFEELIKEKKYANRRSATSGIINTPKNVDYGRYLTIIPLLYFNPANGESSYIAPGAVSHEIWDTRALMDKIEDRLLVLRDANFPYRVDGIVIYPLGKKASFSNTDDFMKNSIAYKINTAEGKTTLEYVYMSVGRMGKAVPMAKVKPVEVNETIVTDVSLGSYERFNSLNLYEGEEVIIFSAGDVIPQLKKTDYANNVFDAPYLKVPKICPYCNEKLTRVSTEYACTNPDCYHVNAGKITNFATKLGMQGFSDKTFEDFYLAGLIKSPRDLFKITADQISSLDGYDTISAQNFINEVDKLMARTITVSEFFGALGIPSISRKKCQKIFEVVDMQLIINAEKSSKIIKNILGADGIGYATAETFAEFVMENQSLIRDLVRILKIREDVRSKGTIVFTKFRSADWKKRFEELGYEVVDHVTGGTKAVVAATSDFSSGNAKAALKKGIPLYLYADIEDLYRDLQHGRI